MDRMRHMVIFEAELLVILNSEFSAQAGCLTKAKEPSLPHFSSGDES